MTWNTKEDELVLDFPTKPAEQTKRGILAKLAKIYDPPGLASLVMLNGELIYPEVCTEKISWDAPLAETIAKVWTKWGSGLPSGITTQRWLAMYQEPIEKIKLHAFGDASRDGVGAAIYAVVTQASEISQGLIAAKSRLAKQGLTIPRLELVAGHMAVNLAVNVRETLEGFPVATDIQC